MEPNLELGVLGLDKPTEKSTLELDTRSGLVPASVLLFPRQQKLQPVHILLTEFLTLASIFVLMLISPILVLMEVMVLRLAIPSPSLKSMWHVAASRCACDPMRDYQAPKDRTKGPERN